MLRNLQDATFGWIGAMSEFLDLLQQLCFPKEYSDEVGVETNKLIHMLKRSAETPTKRVLGIFDTTGPRHFVPHDKSPILKAIIAGSGILSAGKRLVVYSKTENGTTWACRNLMARLLNDRAGLHVHTLRSNNIDKQLQSDLGTSVPDYDTVPALVTALKAARKKSSSLLIIDGVVCVSIDSQDCMPCFSKD